MDARTGKGTKKIGAIEVDGFYLFYFQTGFLYKRERCFMLDKIAQYMLGQFLAYDVVKEEDKEIYIFGIRTFIMQFSHFLILLLLGAMMGIVAETLCFYTAFMLLRIHTGGYHADSASVCFVRSVITNLLALAAISFTATNLFFPIAIGILSFAVPVIFRYAPIDSAKFPLDREAKKVYRRRSLYSLAAVLTCIVFSFFLCRPTIFYAFSIGMLTASLLLFLGVRQK